MPIVRDLQWPWFLWFAWFPVRGVEEDRHWLEWVWVRPVPGGWEYQKAVRVPDPRKKMRRKK